jgi:hypothetical protein
MPLIDYCALGARRVYTHRKEYCRWITEAKKEETQLKKLKKAIEMLKKGVRAPT